ncbi:MAG: PorV/PorQ family protein [Candidatus Neomarinimicrobiota bacterium]
MTRQHRYFTTALIVILMATGLEAEGIKKLAQTSMKWLSIPVGARAMAMGNAYYSVVGTADALFWNPAGTGFVAFPQVSFSSLPWIADINQSTLALAVPVGNIGVLCGSLRYVDFGVFQGTRLAENEVGWEYTEEFFPKAYQAGLGFSRRVTDRFSFGLHFSYAQEQLGTVSYAPVIGGSIDNPIDQDTDMGLVNLDFGVLYFTGFHDLRLGMSLQNFSEEKGYGNVSNPIPMDWCFGMAMDLFSLLPGESDTHKLTLAWELSHPRDYSERLHFGLEYSFVDLVALRMGYKMNYDEESVSYGVGLLPNFRIGPLKLGLDYAYVPFGEFQEVQAFSVVIGF